jgi:hypothetical protein
MKGWNRGRWVFGSFFVACLMAEVGDAEAEDTVPRQVTVDVERCELPLVRNGVTYRVAEHRYPRQRMATLAQVSVIGRRVVRAIEPATPPGYVYGKIVSGVMVRDGSVAVVCGSWSDTDDKPLFDEIMFIMPRHFRVEGPELDAQDPWK